jgi:hypothetical protein
MGKKYIRFNKEIFAILIDSEYSSNIYNTDRSRGSKASSFNSYLVTLDKFDNGFFSSFGFGNR